MDDLFAAAVPECQECGAPIRVEQFWQRVVGTWRLTMTKVCAYGHREPVEPFGASRPPSG